MRDKNGVTEYGLKNSCNIKSFTYRLKILREKNLRHEFRQNHKNPMKFFLLNVKFTSHGTLCCSCCASYHFLICNIRTGYGYIITISTHGAGRPWGKRGEGESTPNC